MRGWLAMTLAAFMLLGGHVHVDGASTDVTLQIGAGCSLSDYATLAVASSTSSSSGSGGKPRLAYRFVQDGGLGSGLYVLHVNQFHLPRNDYVVLRAKDAAASVAAVTLYGRNTTGGFFTKPIAGNGVIVELYKSAEPTESEPENETSGDEAEATKCFGFEMDKLQFTPETDAAKVAVGDEASVTALKMATSPGNVSTTTIEVNESLCGEDESKEAVCYENDSSLPGGAAMYAASKAVARLVIRKDNSMNIAYCTGFLLGCEGHLITNQHCIRDWIDALNTGVEFFAEASQCGQSCQARAACPGRIAIKTATLVAVSTQYDYALIKLTLGDGIPIATLLSQVGGYLQLRASGAKMDETIFIPQYPMGYGKRISSTSSGKPGRVESLSVNTCGGSDVGYYVDTQEGSSGSPVIATSDNLVVALHHCGGCLNGAIPSTQLIADMTTRGVLPRCAVA